MELEKGEFDSHNAPSKTGSNLTNIGELFNSKNISSFDFGSLLKSAAPKSIFKTAINFLNNSLHQVIPSITTIIVQKNTICNNWHC